MFELTGRRGIITGASSGIGLAMAEVLAQAGAQIYVISRSGHPKNPQEPVHENITHLAGDIRDSARMEQLVVQICGTNGLDFLINNAGITIKKRAEELTLAEFDQVQQVNVSAMFWLCKLCYPYLKASAHVGRILNVSSMASHLGFSQVVPYCASKGAVTGLTRGLAIEWVDDNITVNSIAPGWYPSELSRQVMDDARREKILHRIPMHRFGDTKDLGAIAQFLLCDNAAYITGCDFPVDGGALAYGF